MPGSTFIAIVCFLVHENSACCFIIYAGILYYVLKLPLEEILQNPKNLGKIDSLGWCSTEWNPARTHAKGECHSCAEAWRWWVPEFLAVLNFYNFQSGEGEGEGFE